MRPLSVVLFPEEAVRASKSCFNVTVEVLNKVVMIFARIRESMFDRKSKSKNECESKSEYKGE